MSLLDPPSEKSSPVASMSTSRRKLSLGLVLFFIFACLYTFSSVNSPPTPGVVSPRPHNDAPTANKHPVSDEDMPKKEYPGVKNPPDPKKKPHNDQPPPPSAITLDDDASDNATTTAQNAVEQKKDYTTTVVMGRLNEDVWKVQWVHDLLHNITSKYIYIVDDPNSTEPHLERNHGREAMVYLKYIVDHYHDLNDITFFFHTDQVVWHNSLLMHEDSVRTINRMSREHVHQQGYVNTRCELWPGCPEWIKFNPSPAEHNLDPHRLQDMFNPMLFERLFPDEDDYPLYFAQPCCSQFAVSKEAIRRRSLEEYQRIYQWIDEAWLDQYSGRAMEMMWQYIFLRKGQYCPSMIDCYCKQYGLCIEEESKQNLLEKWNQYRTRGEEIQWQIDFREKEISTMNEQNEKVGGEKLNFGDDNIWNRLREDMDRIKGTRDKLKAEVMRVWDIKESQQPW